MKTTIITTLLIALACIIELAFGVRYLGQGVAMGGLVGCLYCGCWISGRILFGDHLAALED